MSIVVDVVSEHPPAQDKPVRETGDQQQAREPDPPTSASGHNPGVPAPSLVRDQGGGSTVDKGAREVGAAQAAAERDAAEAHAKAAREAKQAKAKAAREASDPHAAIAPATGADTPAREQPAREERPGPDRVLDHPAPAPAHPAPEPESGQARDQDRDRENHERADRDRAAQQERDREQASTLSREMQERINFATGGAIPGREPPEGWHSSADAERRARQARERDGRGPKRERGK